MANNTFHDYNYGYIWSLENSIGRLGERGGYISYYKDWEEVDSPELRAKYKKMDALAKELWELTEDTCASLPKKQEYRPSQR